MAGSRSIRFYLIHLADIFILLSIFIIIPFSDTNAQIQYKEFYHLTVNDGLSSNRIRCVFKDSKGFLWIGTDVGLDKYDSYQVKKYRHIETFPLSISNDNLTCIYEDKNKNLWFGTYDGLNLYNPSGDYFTVFRKDNSNSNSLNSNYITGIVEDKKGNVWVVTDGSCLNRWNPAQKNFVRYPFDVLRKGLSIRPSKMAAVDSKGNIWVGSLSPGITCFNPEKGQFKKFDESSEEFNVYSYKSLYIDKDDKIWIASEGMGLFSFDPVTNSFEHFGVKGDGKGTNLNLVLDIIPESDRYLLLAVDQGGINRLDKKTKTFEYFLYDDRNERGLNNSGIFCFHRDQDGILWIGTSGGGLNYYYPHKERFKLFTHNANNPQSLSYNFVGVFFEDHEGMIWIGTDGGGLDVFNPKTGEFRSFLHNPADPYSISGNVIRGIVEDNDHNIWVGTWEAGLNRYDRKTGRFFHFLPDKNDPASISDKTIWNITLDHNNKLWVSIYNVGIDLIDTKKGVIKRFRPDYRKPNSLSAANSWFMFEDFKNKMWICTQNGLDLYNSDKDNFTVFNFPDNDIGSFYRDSTGYLWVGSTAKGLYMCSPDGTILKTYDTKNALPNNRIHSVTKDDKGDIWISTNNGIARINPQIQSVRSYDKEDGLQGDQFYQQSFLKTRKGDLYYGGYCGFNSFCPDSLKDNQFVPPVYLTDFQIFNKPVTYSVPGAQFQTHISEAKEIKLKWNQSVFSFSFAAISYIHPQKNKYAYIMEGFEKDWNITDASRRYVTYTNLDPGKYVFRVKASNNDGVWNENGVALNVIILPPWWKTWWFRIMIFSALALIVLFIFMERIRVLKNQKILLEKLVAEKTNELYELNASKDKFFSIIAHDLKNPFNIIIGFSELMKESIKLQDYVTFYEYTVMINNSAVQTLRLLENLLEWANSQRGKVSFSPVSFNLSDLVKGEFELIEEMAVGKKIDLICKVEDTFTLTADKNMIRTVIRNLIINGVKYTNTNGKVIVNASQSDSLAEVSVSDTGIGMSQETILQLFRIDASVSTRGTANEKGTGIGLILCKEFIEKHGGKIWVESEEGKGSTFIFKIPLNLKTSDGIDNVDSPN